MDIKEFYTLPPGFIREIQNNHLKYPVEKIHQLCVFDGYTLFKDQLPLKYQLEEVLLMKYESFLGFLVYVNPTLTLNEVIETLRFFLSKNGKLNERTTNILSEFSKKVTEEFIEKATKEI